MSNSEEFDDGEPELKYIDGSEIEGVVDITSVGNDGIFRPVFINQEGKDFLNLTREDAKRLLDFLNEAIPYIEKSVTNLKH